jgi:DNA-binding transcriptional LysR family regulator
VHYSLAFGADAPTFEYFDGTSYRELAMRSVITVNSADAYVAACAAGLGIIQCPRSGVSESLAAGTLVEVLPQLRAAPMPVSIVHGHARNVPKRVRAIMSWLAQQLEPHLADARGNPGAGP